MRFSLTRAETKYSLGMLHLPWRFSEKWTYICSMLILDLVQVMLYKSCLKLNCSKSKDRELDLYWSSFQSCCHRAAFWTDVNQFAMAISILHSFYSNSAVHLSIVSIWNEQNFLVTTHFLFRECCFCSLVEVKPLFPPDKGDTFHPFNVYACLFHELNSHVWSNQVKMSTPRYAPL